MTETRRTPACARLGIILVHYHTPDLVARAVDALRADLDGDGPRADVIVVDNGSDAAGREVLTALPIRYLDARDNRGYAAALNLGIASTDAEQLVLMNPDVLVRPGCLSALVRALEDGADCAGPRFYWDESRRFLLPPTEQRTRWAELHAALAEHGGVLERWARNRWRRHARGFWTAERTFATTSLSGALLAVHRRAIERIGPFDERFRLYFEEHDWILRLERAGMSAVHVPEAEAVHLFSQSAAHEPAAAQWFSQSREIFFARHYGIWFGSLLSLLPTPRTRSNHGATRLPAGPPSVDLSEVAEPGGWPLWVEVSSLPRRFPAAATILSDPSVAVFGFPREIWQRLSPGRYFLTVVDRTARELAGYAFEAPPPIDRRSS